MVVTQHTMLVDGLHVDHLRLILGTSMGCMQTFVWGETFPAFSEALAPFACLPVEIAGRNRMMRHMAIDAVKRDPAWKNGDYTTEPTLGLRTACETVFIMGSAPLPLQRQFPTRIAAEQRVDAYLNDCVASTDANDLIYYFDASRNYNPAPMLSTITAPVLWINSADDFINPPELGIAERLVLQMPHAHFVLLPISDATRGHGTHTLAAVWKSYLIDFLNQTQSNSANRSLVTGSNGSKVAYRRGNGICTSCQLGDEASFRYPDRSGSCSISLGSTAASVTCCSLVVLEDSQLPAWRERVSWTRTISRSPIKRLANLAVPPCSLAEQRRISVLPQFSTMVCASASPCIGCQSPVLGSAAQQSIGACGVA
jgi:pimeloyl-ACP methyl ester carboxylesterase